MYVPNFKNMMVFLQKMFQLNCLKYTVPKVGQHFGVKVPMLLDKNPQRIVIKNPCPSSKQPVGHKTVPLTVQRTRLSMFRDSAVIPKELAK